MVLKQLQERYILMVGYKWLDEDEVHVLSLPDYKGYKPGKDCDKALCQDLWDLFDEADIVVAHNGNSFDIKMANAQFIKHGFDPYSYFRSIDTKLEAKKIGRFNSNSLDNLGQSFGVGRKVKHQGFDMWEGCIAGLEKDWKDMAKYCKGDVLLLEKVYLVLRKWMDRHPNVGLLSGLSHACTKCGSTRLTKRGVRWTNVSLAQRFRCKDCRGYSHTKFVSVSETR